MKNYHSQLLMLLLLSSHVIANPGQTLEEIMTPPVDSFDRARLHIPVFVEGDDSCQLTIDILGDSATILRHLVDFKAAPGKYNFYWNKKTDLNPNQFTGQYAFEGEYEYVVSVCGIKTSGVLLVDTKIPEYQIQVTIMSSIATFETKAIEDTLRITVNWYAMKNDYNPQENIHKDDSVAIGRMLNWHEYVDQLIAVVDTLLTKGTHILVLASNKKGLSRNVHIDESVPEGKYLEEIIFGGGNGLSPSMIEYKK